MIKNPLTAVARHFAEQRFWRWATPLLAPGLAMANPTGADIVSGNVAITNTDPNTLTINQSTASAAINWQQFSVGSSEYVVFNQPSVSAITLNRVVGGTPSEIFGHLLSNGRIFLINPNGILFGQGSQIDVGALVASTANISDADFSSGRYVLGNAGTGSVLNNGNIIAGPRGFVVLAADSVTNNGLIQANLGEVVLAAGNAFTLDLTGEGLINFQVDQAALSSQSGVSNLGQVVADGGKVLMTARTAADLARTVVNNQGLVQAHSISQTESGEIVLQAVGGDIDNAGTLDASAINGAAGGAIQLVSDHATKLEKTSVLDAHGSGLTDGGSVHVSGHSVLVRGLINLGHGGNLVLDPTDMEIKDGYGSVGSNQIYERWIEDELRGGNNITITATHSITMDALTDGVLDGRGSLAPTEFTSFFGSGAGAGNGGALTLGIGSGGLGGPFYPGSGGGPGGGYIQFVNLANAIKVDGNLRIQGGQQYGGINVGDLAATKGSIYVQAVEGIHTGNDSAGGNIQIYNNGAGDITVGTITGQQSVNIYDARGAITAGDITGHGQVAILAQQGNLNLHDVTVLQNTTNPNVYLYAEAYGSGSSRGHVNINKATVATGPTGLEAYASIHATQDVVINDLVMHGGGGTFPNQYQSQMAYAWIQANNGDITVHAADITTDPVHGSSSFGGPSNHYHNVNNHADAFVGMQAGGKITLGDLGGGVFAMDAHGDAHLNLSASSDITLNNVSVAAEPVLRSHFHQSYGSAYSSPAWHYHFHLNSDANNAVTAEIDGNTYRNIIVPTGGAVSVTATGNANLRLHAGSSSSTGGVTLDGNVAVTANAAFYTNHSSNRAHSSTWARAPIGHSRNSNNYSSDFGGASLNVTAHYAPVEVGGTVNVTGAGLAQAYLRASGSSAGIDIATGGALTVLSQGGHASNNHLASNNSFVTSAGRNVMSYGDAYAGLNAPGGLVTIHGTVSVTGSDAPVNSSGGSFHFARLWLQGGSVDISGGVNVTGNQAAIYQQKHRLSSDSYGSFHAGAAMLNVHASNGSVTIENGAAVDVQGNGFAKAFITANGGGVNIDGTLTVNAGTAQFSQERSNRSGSGASHNRHHESGSYGSAYAQISAYGGDLVINGTVNVEAPVDATLNLYAGLVAFVPHHVIIGSHGNAQVNATGALHHHAQDSYGYAGNLYRHSDSSGSAAYAELYVSADGFTLAYGGNVAVTGTGNAEAVINTKNHGDVLIDGALSVTGNRAYFNSHHDYISSSGPDNNHGHDYGSMGNAEVRINVDRYGSGSGGNFIEGATGVITVQDHGGAPGGSHPSALLDIEARGYAHVHGHVTVDGSHGWHQHYANGFETYYRQDYASASYVDGGQARLDLHAGNSVSIGSSAVINVHAYGNVSGSITANNNNDVFVDGKITVTADPRLFHGSRNPGSYWDHASGYASLRTSGSAYGSANLRVYGHDVSFSSHANVTVQGAGYAALQVQVPGDITVNGALTVSADSGMRDSHYTRGRYVETTSGSSFVLDYSRFYHLADYGSAYLSLHAGSGSQGRVTINGPVTVMGAGYTTANITGNAPSGAAAVTINNALTVKDRGGHYSYGSTRHNPSNCCGSSDSYRTDNHSYAGFGHAHLFLGAFGSNNDIVVTAAGSTGPGGSVLVQAPGDARLEVYATRDLQFDGAVSVTADAGSYAEFRPGTQTYPRSGDVVTDTWTSSAFGRAGYANLQIDNARDLTINAPLTITGNGGANLNPYVNLRNVTISAPLQIIDNGSYSQRHYSSSSNRVGSNDPWHYTYRSDSGGAHGSYAHSGGANANFTVYGNFLVNSGGSITVRGVDFAGLNVNAYNGASGYGHIDIHGPITVHADANSYRYGSSYNSTRTGTTSHFQYTSNSSIGRANVHLTAANDLHLYSGAPINASAPGNVDFFLSAGNNLLLDAPITVRALAGHYHSNSSYQSHQIKPSKTSDYSSSFSYDSHFGHVNANLVARHDVTIGSGGGVTMDAYGHIGLNITAGAYGSYGDIRVNGPISLHNAGSNSASHYRQHSNSANTNGYNSYFDSHSANSFRGGYTTLNLNANGYTSGSGTGAIVRGGHLAINAGISADGVGNVTVTGTAPNGIDVEAPIHLNAHASHSYSSYNSSGDRVAIGGLTGRHFSSNSFSSSNHAHAELDLTASRGPLHVGGTGVTVSGDGYAGVNLSGNYSDGAHPSYGVTIGAPITITGRPSHSAWDSTSFNSYFNVGSGAVRTQTQFRTSHQAGTSHQGTGNLSVYSGIGDTVVNGAVSVTGAGYANAAISAYKNVTINAPVTVTATSGLSSSVRSQATQYTSSGSPEFGFHPPITYFNSFAYGQQSRFGGASFNVYAFTGNIDQNAAVTVSGVGFAQAYFHENYYYNTSSPHALNLRAPITVTATGGSQTRFANSSHQATLMSGSTATVLSHGVRHETWSGLPGQARLQMQANYADITGYGSATIDVSANGSAYASAHAFGGNVSLPAPVSVTANAAPRGHHLDGVSFSNARYDHSYGNALSGSYGQAQFDVLAQFANSHGGNITLGSVQVAGAGQASAGVHDQASGAGGTITLNGPITVNGGMGHFDSTDYNKNTDLTNGDLHSFSSHHAGSIGYGSLYMNGNGGAGITGGSISVTGAGRATAQLTTWSGGGINLSGPVTITANPGHFQYDHQSLNTSGAAHNSSSVHIAASGGQANLTAQAYNGGNVNFADVTVQGFGSSGWHVPGGANAYIWSQYGTAAAHHLTVNAGLGSRVETGHYQYNNPGQSGSSHYGSNNAFGSARAYMYGYAGVNLGSLDMHASGYAGAAINGYNGLTVTGPITITATQGMQSGHHAGFFVNGSYNSNHGHNTFSATSGSAQLSLTANTGNLDVAGITVSADGWANANLHASNGSVTVAGPIGIYSTKRAIQVGSQSNHGHSGTYHHLGSTVWNSSAGSANLNINAWQNVNVGAIDMAASGSVRANIRATAGSANVGPVTLNAKAGNYDRTNRNGYSYTGRPSTSTSSGYPGYQNSSHYHRVATSGSASLEVYGGAGITVGAVDLKGAGYVNANFGANNSGANAQLGPVSLTVTARRVATSTGGNSYDNHQGYRTNNSYNNASSYGSAFLNAHAAGTLNAGSITVNGLGYAGATLQGNGGVTVSGPITVATLAGTQDRSANAFNHYSNGFSYTSDTHNTQDAGSAYLRVSGPNVTVTGAIAVAGAGNAYGSLHASTGSLNVLGPVSVVSQGGHYTHDNHYIYHYNSGSGTVIDNHNQGTSDGGSASLYAKAPSISLGSVTVSAAPGFAYGLISASNGAMTLGPVSVTGGAAHTVRDYHHTFVNGAGTSSGASSSHRDNSAGNASLHLAGLRGVTINGAATVSGAGHAGANVSASSGSVTASGPITATAARGRFAGSNHQYNNGSLTYSNSHFGSYGEAVTNIHGPTVNVGGAGAIGNGLGSVSVTGNTVAAGDVTALGGLGTYQGVDQGRAYAYISGPLGVTLNTMNVGGASIAFGQVYASSGSVTATGVLGVTTAPAGSIDYGQVYLFVNAQNAVTLQQGLAVAADGNALVNVNAPVVTIGGVASVTVTPGNQGNGLYGSATLNVNNGNSTAVTTVNDINVTGAGTARVTIDGDTVSAHDITVASGIGHGTGGSSWGLARAQLNGKHGVSVNNVAVSAFSFGSASLYAASGSAMATGKTDVSGQTAVLNVYGQTGAGIAQGGTVAGVVNGNANISTPATVTMGGNLTVSGRHAQANITGNTGVTLGSLAVAGSSSGGVASIHANSGAIAASGKIDVSGYTARLTAGASSGVSIAQGGTVAGVVNGQTDISTPGTITIGGTQVTSGQRATATLNGTGGVTVNNLSVGGGSSGGLASIFAFSGAVTANRLDVAGSTAYLNVYGQTGVAIAQGGTVAGVTNARVTIDGQATATVGGTLTVSGAHASVAMSDGAVTVNNLTVTGGISSGSASLHASNSAVTATGAINISGNGAFLTASGPASVTLAQGATLNGVANAEADVLTSGAATIGGTLAVNAPHAIALLRGDSGVTLNNVTVGGSSFGSASISASNGAVTATGNFNVSGRTALLNVYGQTGVSLVGGTVAGTSTGRATISTPGTATLTGTLTVSGSSAQANVTGSSGVSVNNVAVNGGAFGTMMLHASSGAVTATGTLSGTGPVVSITANGASGVTVNNVNASGSSSATVNLFGGSGLAKATGTVAVTGGNASLDVGGADANLVNGATVTGTSQAFAAVSATNNATVGGTLTVAGPQASASVVGSTAVSVNNLTVTGGATGGTATLTGGAVTVAGATNVTGNAATLSATGTNLSFNSTTITGTATANATLNGTGTVSVASFNVTGGSSASADVNAGGTLSMQNAPNVTATGNAFLDLVGSGGVTLSNGATVAGGNNAVAVINGGPMTLGTVSVTATGTGLAELNVAGSGAVNATSFNVAGNGDAAVVLAGTSGLVGNVNVNAGATATFADTGVHVTLAQVDGSDAAIGGQGGGNVDMLVVNAAHDITESSGASLFANAAGFVAGHAINLSGGSLALGSGSAPFGADNISEFLIHVAAPGLIGSITPNGAFSAPSVTFGNLDLGGNAIFIQTDSVGYNGTIAINPLNPLPTGGFVIRYDTFTANAKIHIVGTLPGTLVAGDVYFDAADFAYPGTTYLVGGTYSYSPMEIGENGAPAGGNGGDDNFFLLTNSDVAIDTPIPTSGQVLVIHPLAVNADLNVVPTAADWQVGSGTDTSGGTSTETDQEKKEALEHQQQTQTGGGSTSEEGQVDSQSGANLECH